MFLKRNAFVFACYVILHYTVKTETPNEEKSEEEFDADEDSTQRDDHTFVALIDIVFTDGSKRTCTGAIIHDNVVITAAHCFTHEYNESIKPELTASFVVIGTKKMFDSGYEQYLPIERILTHPRFKGWTADLSLIYTFATMTSDKPGKVIPLAGEKMSNPVDSNVTVFSWGRCKEHGVKHKWHISVTTASNNKEPDCDDSSREEKSINSNINEENHRATVGINSKRTRGELKIENQLKRAEGPKKHMIQQSRFKKESRKDDRLHQPSLRQKIMVTFRQTSIPAMEINKSPTAKHLSRYLTSSEDNKEGSGGHIVRRGLRGRIVRRSLSDNIKIYKNWRRNMGKSENKLTVEIFGFVNLGACKKIVDGSSSAPRFDFKNGEVACYTSEEHFITEEDSGAPAVRHGHLVAVTVGGAQSDDDHVGVGMKMSCYCTWIADNLPGGGANINCCKNCCDVSNEDSSRNMSRKNRNQYLL